MPILSGLDVCKKVLSEKAQTRFILLTMHKKKHFFRAAMEAGVQGYLLKDNAIQDLIRCLEADRPSGSPDFCVINFTTNTNYFR